MKVLSIRTLRGPNYWSNYRKNLIAMKLDLEEAEQRPSNTFPFFVEKLEQLIPSLYEHRCSEDSPGGFFERVRKGTWMGHIVEHIALELQSLAGMECGYGRTRSTHKPGIYHVVFEFVIENAGHYAAKAAVRIAEALMNDEGYDINRDLEELRKIFDEEGPGPAIRALLKEARKRNIPVKPIERYSTVMLGYGKHNRTISEFITSQPSIAGVYLTGEKSAEPVIKMLFPPGTPSRIPIVAITGTNGKTTTTRLISHIAKAAGYTVGFTNTDGVYINDQLIFNGDCSGPSSAEVVLRDPSVDFAVLECARGGILRAGLAFDYCDISIVTNIAGDHLGMDDIETIHELARVKSVVPRSTRPEGMAILNADDDLVYRMRHEVDCDVALFSIHEKNERVLQHCAEGGMAAIVEKGYFTICKGEWKLRIARVNEVPLTQGGKASCMIKNILPAILAAAARDFDTAILRQALFQFIPGPDFTPGRMNIFRFPQFEVMVDYVHNIHGFEEMRSFLQQVNATEKVGIITAPGDRKDEDIIQTGRIAAEIFDRIIIRHDEDMRGRDKEELTGLIVQGIRGKDDSKSFEVVSNELEALNYAMDTAKEGAFIVLSAEHTHEVINELKKQQKESLTRTQV